MKAIEKLANESLKDLELGDCGCYDCQMIIWPAGFRKARELIASKLEGDWDKEHYEIAPYALADDARAIGEEEVNESTKAK